MVAAARGQVRPRPSLDADVGRLWAAYSISEVGTAIGAGALPLIAVLALDASTFQIALLAGLSGIASAVLAIPIGSQVEFRRKRPTMVAADLVRFAALGSVPAAAAMGVLSFTQLCVVGVVETLGAIVFGAASGAHLKALVPAGLRLAANSRFETTFWVATTAGPPLGGVLISWLGATVTLAVDAVSFLLSAVGIRRIRRPEPPPPAPLPDGSWRSEVVAGWSAILRHPGLARLFWNAMVFGGCIVLASSLMALLMLRDQGLAPWQYGLALGLPGLGGILGALCTKPITTRLGSGRTLLLFGVLRTAWLGLVPLAPPGAVGLTVIVVAETGLLLSAGVFNPTFVTYRMDATDDDHLSRVLAAWSISAKVVQPAFVLVGGVIAAVVGVRATLAGTAIVLASSALLLPWRHPTAEPA